MNHEDARSIGQLARRRVLREHTSEHRAQELETYVYSFLQPARRFNSPDMTLARPTGSVVH
jgi:hypothetical protein